MGEKRGCSNQLGIRTLSSSSSTSTISGSDSVAPVGELKGLPGMTFKGLVGLGEVFLLLVWWELEASFSLEDFCFLVLLFFVWVLRRVERCFFFLLGGGPIYTYMTPGRHTYQQI